MASATTTTIRVSREVHKLLLRVATEEDRTIRTVVDRAIRAYDRVRIERLRDGWAAAEGEKM